eukprot:RCo048731
MPLVTVRHDSKVSHDISLFYDTFGNPSAEPLMLVMGLSSQMIMWRPAFCEKLAQAGFYVIRFDNRDVGLSVHLDHLGIPPLLWSYLRSFLHNTSAPYTISDMAADVVALMDHLRLPSAHLMGISMGGMIVQQIAVNHPTRVRSLASLHSPAGLWGGSLGVKLGLIRPVPKDREALVKYRVTYLKSISGKKYFDAERVEELVREGLARAFYPPGTARQTAAVLAANFRAEGLDSIGVPTVVMHGADDPLVPPRSGKVIAEAIPGARLVMLPDVAHDLPPELYDLIVGEVRSCADRAAGSHGKHGKAG